MPNLNYGLDYVYSFCNFFTITMTTIGEPKLTQYSFPGSPWSGLVTSSLGAVETILFGKIPS